jgi:hypothetical protein
VYGEQFLLAVTRVAGYSGGATSLYMLLLPGKILPSQFAAASSAFTCSAVLPSCASAVPDTISAPAIANIRNACLPFMVPLS